MNRGFVTAVSTRYDLLGYSEQRKYMDSHEKRGLC